MNEIEDIELLRLKTRQTNLAVNLGDQIRDLTLQQQQTFLVIKLINEEMVRRVHNKSVESKHFLVAAQCGGLLCTKCSIFYSTIDDAKAVPCPGLGVND